MLITFNCKTTSKLFNLLFNMFLVSFCIITITVCYITKFQIFLHLTKLFLCNFLSFLLTSISYSNFSHFCKFIFIKRSFTNCLYITLFVDVVYLYLFLASNTEIQKPILDLKKKKFKISPFVIEVLTAL